jgi:hypothetical protein
VFQPATLNLDGFSTFTDTLTISTTAASVGGSLAGPLSLSFACSLFLLWPRKKRMRTWWPLAIALGVLSVGTGCGGGNSPAQSSGSTKSATTPYIVLVTAAGTPAGGAGETAVSQTVSLAVTIQ